MTALVSLLFIAMIPTDCKITNFSLHLFVYFFCNNYNIWWSHKCHFKRKNDHEYYFLRSYACVKIAFLYFLLIYSWCDACQHPWPHDTLPCVVKQLHRNVLCTKLSSQVFYRLYVVILFKNSQEKVFDYFIFNSCIESVTPLLGRQCTPLLEAPKPALSIPRYNTQVNKIKQLLCYQKTL